LIPGAGKIWLERLQAVPPASILAVVDQVPPSRMSVVCREFTLEMLRENQRRLVAGESE
jgi:hypothetical protein